MTMSHGNVVTDGNPAPAAPGGRAAGPPRAAARRRLTLGCALILAPLMIGLTGCSGGPEPPRPTGPYDAAADVSFGPAEGPEQAAVDPADPLRVTATSEEARITDVTAVDAAGRTVTGELTADGGAWSSTTPLAAGIEYTVEVATENRDGHPGRRTHVFTTRDADSTALEITFGPKAGTYGVGQPVIAELSEEVEGREARAVVERLLTVESEPATEGTWHWADGATMHYRPAEYWPANATVRVSSDLAGVHIQDGLRGAESEPLTIRTGDRVEAIADIGTLTMTVTSNGEVVRTMPMTTGKEGFRTREGKKVILGKEQHVRMNGASIGIAQGSSEYYDLDVYWAARLTWSGEYVHGAPWSVGSHGSQNVSHGCTGLSTENARWFFEFVKVGDIVEHVNGYGNDMDLFGNGFGDWNMSWDDWRQGSALHGDTEADAGTGDSGRLRPSL